MLVKRGQIYFFKKSIVDLDEPYLALGENKSERQEAYEQYVRDTIPEGEIKLIRDSLQRGQLTGNERFRQEILQRQGIRFSNKGPGRPKKSEK